MGDDEGGPATQRLTQSTLDRCLRLGVEVGGGLVEHDDVGCLEHQAGQGHPLLLASREPVAALADHRVEPVGQIGHDVTDLGLLHGPEHLGLAGLGSGVDEVGPQGVVEEVGVLGDHAHHVAERRHGGVAHVDAARCGPRRPSRRRAGAPDSRSSSCPRPRVRPAPPCVRAPPRTRRCAGPRGAGPTPGRPPTRARPARRRRRSGR